MVLVLSTPKPPILFRGLFSLKARISPGSIAWKALAPGCQKSISTRPVVPDRKSNQSLSVLATKRLTTWAPGDWRMTSRDLCRMDMENAPRAYGAFENLAPRTQRGARGAAQGTSATHP